MRVWLSYILAELLVSLSCTPCLALSYLIHPRELRDVTIILPCNQYKIFGCPASWSCFGGRCIPYDCLSGEWDAVYAYWVSVSGICNADWRLHKPGSCLTLDMNINENMWEVPS